VFIVYITVMYAACILSAAWSSSPPVREGLGWASPSSARLSAHLLVFTSPPILFYIGFPLQVAELNLLTFLNFYIARRAHHSPYYKKKLMKSLKPIIQLIVTILTAILTTLGTTSCITPSSTPSTVGVENVMIKKLACNDYPNNLISCLFISSLSGSSASS